MAVEESSESCGSHCLLQHLSLILWMRGAFFWTHSKDASSSRSVCRCATLAERAASSVLREANCGARYRAPRVDNVVHRQRIALAMVAVTSSIGKQPRGKMGTHMAPRAWADRKLLVVPNLRGPRKSTGATRLAFHPALPLHHGRYYGPALFLYQIMLINWSAGLTQIHAELHEGGGHQGGPSL